MLVNVLKQRRQRDHEFSWQQALQVNGDTGIKLQYTHCRLHSLLENFAHVNLADVKPSWRHLTQEPSDAMDLIYELARFEQSVWQSKEQLEACILVNYLFGLWCVSLSASIPDVLANLSSRISILQQCNESCTETTTSQAGEESREAITASAALSCCQAHVAARHATSGSQASQPNVI